jgi:hypothetical protein
MAHTFQVGGKEAISSELEDRWQQMSSLLASCPNLTRENSVLHHFVTRVRGEEALSSTPQAWKSIFRRYRTVRKEFLLKHDLPDVPIVMGSPLWPTMIAFMLGFESSVSN